jgi:hypothetical protein
MDSSIFLVILLSTLICLIVAIIAYVYGKINGNKEALLQPNWVYPKISDITILSKYSIPFKTNEQISRSLSEANYNIRGYYIFTSKNLIEIHRKKSNGKTKDYFKSLETTRNGIPDSLTLRLSPISNNSKLEVATTCLPVMASKLGQMAEQKFAKSNVEDAQRFCKDFTMDVMCILDGKPIILPYVESETHENVSSTFLYNTPSKNMINQEVHNILTKANNRIFLTGWVDREFLGDLESAKEKGVQIKIITKNPQSSDKLVKDDFERLFNIFNKNEIRINSKFHDRFIICDSQLIIGSMYFVDASKSRYESVLTTSDSNILMAITEHFQRIWDDVNSKQPSK